MATTSQRNEKVKQEPSRVEIGYIRMQGIAYFVFALLFARSAAVGPEAAFLSFGESRIQFPFPLWMPLSLAIISLVISFLFLGTLFYARLTPFAIRLAVWLSFPFYTAVLASFVVSWLGGVTFLEGLPRLWFEVFFWAGAVVFAILSIHFILTPLRRRRMTDRNRTLAEWLNKAKMLFQHVMPKGKSCLDCGYLAFPVPVDRSGREKMELPRSVRFNWRNEKMLEGTANAICYRNIWDNRNDGGRAANPDRVLRTRYCSKFFPYLGGSPKEHADSHRSRTNRRWLVAGSLMGPYVATSAGFIASEAAKNGDIPMGLMGIAFLGLLALLVVVFSINLMLNRS